MTTPLTVYTRTAHRAAAEVIAAYSTSFGLASRLLDARHRQHVTSVYALVRVADEIVDGVAAEAGLDADARRAALDAYEASVSQAVRTGFSTDLVVHAFASTARATGIDETLTVPFFAAMRSDLEPGEASRDRDAHAAYVHGSAEVVGLMCLRIFLREEERTVEQLAVLEEGATRLGAAFQNVNFLRDLADDTGRLGRSYLTPTGRLTTTEKDHWVASIRADLAAAHRAIPLLPHDARAAVRSAADLFARLTDRVDATSVDHLYQRRVRVPDAQKAALTARAVLTTWKERST